MPFCSNCGAALETGAKFCGECGQPVTAKPIPEQKPLSRIDPSKSFLKKIKKYLLHPVSLGIYVLILAMVVLYIWWPIPPQLIHIKTVAFSPDGQLLASGSMDRTFKLWNLGSSKEIITSEHPGEIGSIVFSPDGKTLVSGSRDGTIKFWDISSGKETNTLKSSSGLLTSISLNPDGKTLAIGSAVGFSRDQSGGWVSSGSAKIELWDIPSNKLIHTLSGDSSTVSSVAFLPGGKILASGGYDSRTVKLWNPETGELLRNFQLKKDSSKVTSIAFSPDGKTLAAGTFDQMILLWDLGNAQPITSFEIKPKFGSDSIHTVAFSPDGSLFAGSNSSMIDIWETKTWQKKMTVNPSTEGRFIFFESVAFSPDWKTVALGTGDGTVKLWDLNTGSEIRTLNHQSWLKKNLLGISQFRYQ